jgi:DNA-directed RNA polymerase specialized sigma24 family protein
MSDLTRILSQIESGDPSAAEELLPLVYDELRKLAAAKLAQEKPGQTLQATALVHEAYLRLVGTPGVRDQESGVREEDPGDRKDVERNLTPAFHSRAHFFAAAAVAMRRILVENARRKQRIKHGGLVQRVELPDVPADPETERLLQLDEALTALAAEDSLAARVVELRHFAGLSHEGVSGALQITVYQARQKWTYARAWLQNALTGE